MKDEMDYETTEREGVAVVRAVTLLEPYLLKSALQHPNRWRTLALDIIYDRRQRPPLSMETTDVRLWLRRSSPGRSETSSRGCIIKIVNIERRHHSDRQRHPVDADYPRWRQRTRLSRMRCNEISNRISRSLSNLTGRTNSNSAGDSIKPGRGLLLSQNGENIGNPGCKYEIQKDGVLVRVSPLDGAMKVVIRQEVQPKS